MSLQDMNCQRRSRGWRRCSKALFRITLLLGLVWFLWVGVLENDAAPRISNAQFLIQGGGKEPAEMVDKKSLPHKTLEINFVSKRRVPNGPDPIHNRRAGNSHRPPGRS